MAWSVGRATWVGELTDPEISQQVGTRTFERGQAYAVQRRVRSLAARPEGMMLLGTVEGSRETSYQTIIEARPHPKGRSPLWSGRCSCPVGNDCKHVVALLLLARDVANGKDPGDAEVTVAEPPAPAPLTHWAEVLGHVKRKEPPAPSTPRPRPEPRGELMPAGLFVDTIYRGGYGAWNRQVPDLGYGLRPTRWTRTRTWHKTLSWHEALPQWRGGLRYLPEHEQIMSKIHDVARGGSGSTTYFTQSPPLALDASGEVWALLRQARDAGIEILPGEGVVGPVEILDEPASLELHIARVDDESGDLVVRTTVEGIEGDVSGALWLGEPVHGVVLERDDGTLTLAEVVQDLGLDASGLRHALEGLRVPAEERVKFLRAAVPGIRDRVRVRSDVPLPVVDPLDDVPHPAKVTVHVRVISDMSGEIRLALGYAYDGALRAFATERFGGGSSGPRDREAEVAVTDLATSVRGIEGAVRVDVLGHLTVAPLVILKGIRAARFVSDILPELEGDEHVTLEVDGELPAYEEVTTAPVIRLGTEDPSSADGRGGEPGDWFDLHVSIEVAGEEVPFEPLFEALAREDEIMLLESGTWFRLDRPELHRLRDLIQEAKDLEDPETGGFRLSAHHTDFWDELVALGVVDSQSARWSANVEALALVHDGPVPDVPESVRANLRPYQLDGFRWLARLWDARIGGILADDMGLGKTLQVITALARARDKGELGPLVSVAAAQGHGPVLVVAPTSVVGTWLGEFETFAPDIPVVALGETTRKRGLEIADTIGDAEVVVTSYAVLRLDDESFHEIQWGGVILDEAQFVKNRQAKTHVAVRKLNAPFTIAVTGTPLENSLMDLWSLLSLTAPGLYPRPDLFTQNYRKPIESGERPELLDLLRRRIRPIMLRRTKEQVAIDLPPKQIQVIPVTPHPVHQHIYDQHLQRERQRVLGLLGDPDANRVAILAALTRLRQLALDPQLVDDAHIGKATAAKVEHLVQQLRELAAEGHRALVFSQFTGFLRIVERALDDAGLRTCYLDGSTQNRQEVIRSFRDGQAAAFLISLKAGGFGLTLTEADYVFVLDPWWNPAAEAQAIDRAHRIGQKRPVTVYRLVSEGTIEEKVVALQERKRDLFQRVIDEGGSMSGAITADDVKDLLGLL